MLIERNITHVVDLVQQWKTDGGCGTRHLFVVVRDIGILVLYLESTAVAKPELSYIKW